MKSLLSDFNPQSLSFGCSACLKEVSLSKHLQELETLDFQPSAFGCR